jgi:hypothetical protein
VDQWYPGARDSQLDPNRSRARRGEGRSTLEPDESPASDLSIQDSPIQCDPGCLASISSMKVRWVVIAEEHQDRDPVEGANPGHRLNVQPRPDRFDSARSTSREQPHLLARQPSGFQVARFDTRSPMPGSARVRPVRTWDVSQRWRSSPRDLSGRARTVTSWLLGLHWIC